MIPVIGLMIGSYIVTRTVDTLSRTDNGFVIVPGIITIAGTLFGMVWLFQLGFAEPALTSFPSWP